MSEHLRYPLPSYHYRVELNEDTMSFSKVSGIVVEYDTLTYRHGLSFLEGEQISTVAFNRFQDISLERGVVQGDRGVVLFDWLKKKDSRSMKVGLCDSTGQQVLVWSIGHAIPVKLEAPSFDAGSNDVAIETLKIKGRSIRLEDVA